jgi:hypothetical protein
MAGHSGLALKPGDQIDDDPNASVIVLAWRIPPYSQKFLAFRRECYTFDLRSTPVDPDKH